MKKGFSLLELVIVLVIIGILISVAMPKLMATRDDANIAKARTTISTIRSSINNIHTKNLMKGLNYYPEALDDAEKNKEDEELFDGNDTIGHLLDYPVYSKDSNGHWMKTDDKKYTIKLQNTDVKFEYNSDNGHFDCKGLNSGKADDLCKTLTH